MDNFFSFGVVSYEFITFCHISFKTLYLQKKSIDALGFLGLGINAHLR